MQNESDLLDTDLLPIRTAVKNLPVVCEAAPTGCPVVICFAPYIGSSRVLALELHVLFGDGEGLIATALDRHCSTFLHKFGVSQAETGIRSQIPRPAAPHGKPGADTSERHVPFSDGAILIFS